MVLPGRPWLPSRAVALVQGRAGEVRDGGLKPLETAIQWQQGVAAEGDDAGLSSALGTLEQTSFGSIGTSEVVERWRHFCTVVGLTPKRLASALTLPCCSWIARR